MSFRTDRNNNPTAFTTDIATQGGLAFTTDYIEGDSFTVGIETYYTAKLLGDPLQLTIKVIDRIGFYNNIGSMRWSYIGMPPWIWNLLSIEQKIQVIKFMYQHEGGTELMPLFNI